jgi:hypothetical protein
MNDPLYFYMYRIWEGAQFKIRTLNVFRDVVIGVIPNRSDLKRYLPV